MEFTQRHNDLIYGALEVFLEKDSPSLVAREEDGLISFSTVLGLNGVIEREEDGSANVFLEGQKYYEIEKEVFHLLENRNEAPEVESLLEELAIIHQMELQERSKIIVDQKVTVGVDIQLGPVLIKNTDDMGNVKILLN